MRRNFLLLVGFFYSDTALLAQELVCPEGSSLKGAAPSAGVELYCAKNDGVFHGPYQRWYENGQLMLKQNYKNGKAHGEQKSWWPNGQLMMQGSSINGRRYRHYQYWDINGQPKQIDTEVVKKTIKQ